MRQIGQGCTCTERPQNGAGRTIQKSLLALGLVSAFGLGASEAVAQQSIVSALVNGVQEDVDISCEPSVAAFGNAANTTITLNLGANAAVTAVGWDVVQEAIDPSWLNEMVVAWISTSGAGVAAAPSGTAAPGIEANSSGGLIDLIGLGLQFNLDADGLLHIHLFEDFVDFPAPTPDGFWGLDCGFEPPPPDSNCCESQPFGNAGCDDAACEAEVCIFDPFCCDTSWDGSCAAAANDICDVCQGGTPACGDGSCCAANGTPGCDDAACCDFMCTVDPFCCDTSWDAICAGQAAECCTVCGGGPDTCAGIGACCNAQIGDPVCQDTLESACAANGGVFQGVGTSCAAGDCDNGGGEPICDCDVAGPAGCPQNPACESCVCTLDAFCCDTSWDGICAGLATGDCASDCCDSGTPGGCAGFCGGQSPEGCWCDASCPGFSDCCSNFCEHCDFIDPVFCGAVGDGCEGFCGGQSPEGCWCDSSCPGFSDCCSDFCDHCDFIDPLFCGAEVGECGDEDAGDCFAANGSPNCDDAACCNAVCACDPFCCETTWDSFCASTGFDPDCLCGPGNCGALNTPECEPPPQDCPGAPLACNFAAGDCLVANGSPGCEICDCCQQICAADAFCCNTTWDGLCAGAAAANPACQPDVEPCDPEESCNHGHWKHQHNHGDWVGFSPADNYDAIFGTTFAPTSNCCSSQCIPTCAGAGNPTGCDDADCTAQICAMDAFCCNTGWDGLCASAANANCAVCQGSGVYGDATLNDALNNDAWGGSAHNRNLARDCTSALLNAAHPDICYPFTTDEVIEMCNGATGGSAQEVNAVRQTLNVAGPCPLSGGNNSPQANNADLNADLTVDGFDLMLLLSDWGTVDPSVPSLLHKGDLNNDGVIDGFDLLLLMAYWGPVPH